MPPRADRRSVLLGLSAAALGPGALLACAPRAAGPATDRELDLSSLEARHGGRLGFALTGPHGRLLWRGDERFTYCSTFKAFLAAATLQRVARGEERLDRAVPITAADIIVHAPVTGPAVGRSLTIQQLCRATVVESDNPAANILIREMGGLEAWRLWYRSIGDHVTRVDRWEPALNIVGDDLDTTTPAQATANLTWLKPEVFTPQTSAPYLIQWFGNPAGAGRLRAGLPAEGATSPARTNSAGTVNASPQWALLHKTGTSSAGPTNDIGYIVPHGGGMADTLVAAAYFEAPAKTTLAQREAVIADALRAALSTLGHEAAS